MLRRFLPKVAAIITQHHREIVQIRWSSKSIVHNIFRLHELLFGRRKGIRLEMTTHKSLNGAETVRTFTFEARCAFLETQIRTFLESLVEFIRRLSYVRIQVLYLATPDNVIKIPYLLAIAFDAAKAGIHSTTSPITLSHTVTGTDPFLSMGFGSVASSAAPTVSSATYNSVALTQAVDITDTTSAAKMDATIWFLGNPSTGANTLSCSWSGGTVPDVDIFSSSYSGSQSGSTADASGSTHGITTGDQTFTVTTVADNCWVVAFGNAAAGSAATCTADQTSRATSSFNTNNGLNAAMRIEDNNAAVTPAGAVTMGFTVGGTSFRAFTMVGASFAPATGGGGNSGVSSLVSSNLPFTHAG